MRARMRRSKLTQTTSSAPRCLLFCKGACNAAGMPFVSPKGDAPGFVKVVDACHLVIPDRPGNRLLFGLQCMLDNPAVGQ